MADGVEIDDGALRLATGRSLSEWQMLIGKAGLSGRGRAELLSWLDHEHSVPSWWREVLAGACERAEAGAEDSGEVDDVEVRVHFSLVREKVYALWTEDGLRAMWLRRADLVLTDCVERVRVRGDWIPLKSVVEVEFRDAAEGGTDVVVRHRGLPNARAAGQLKRFWWMVLGRLRASAEGEWDRVSG